jgi:hypothetical protein
MRTRFAPPGHRACDGRVEIAVHRKADLVTFYEPNSDVRPIGEEAGEFIELPPREPDDENDEGDPSARPTGSPPLQPP